MPVDPKLAVRYASLRKEDREALFDLVHRHEGVLSLDEAKLDEALAQAAGDRLDFAERRAVLARAVFDGLPGDEDMARRDALIGAYDAIHHALRALHIGFAGWDPIGHAETLEETGRLFGENGDLAKRFEWLKLGRPLQDVVADLRTERQAAEWDVHNEDEKGAPRVDYKAQASVAVGLAEGVVRTVRAALYDRRAGGL